MSTPRIAIWTLTRDRIAYTKRMLESLRRNAGMEYRHYIVDNGSTDGTQSWLRKTQPALADSITLLPTNLGIGGAGNKALDLIERDGGADFVVKIDNDCELVTLSLFPRMLEAFAAMPPSVLSPSVAGIVRQPRRSLELEPAHGIRIGVTGHVGGLFLMAPRELWEGYRFPTNLPKARGYDTAFNRRAVSLGATVGYVEDLVVAHMDTTDGQVRKYPAYFARKRGEER